MIVAIIFLSNEMNRQLTYKDERGDFEQRWDFVQKNRRPLSLLLDGLEDPRNIGSLFRLADSANLAHVYFYNCSIQPTDKRLKRTARSTQKYVNSSIIHDITAIHELKNTHQFIALEITSDSIPYTECQIESPTILIIGKESHGVSEALLALSDKAVHIPMYGINTSMNVAVASAITTFHFIQQF